MPNMSDDTMDDALDKLLSASDIALPVAPDTPMVPLTWTQTVLEDPLSLEEPWGELDWLLATPDILGAELSVEATPAASTPAPMGPIPGRSSLDTRDQSEAAPKRRLTTKHRIQLLKEELERLKLELEAARRQAQTTGKPSAVVDEVSEAQAYEMWQAISARQQQRREQAEADNRRLRRLVFAHRRHLSRVRRLLVNPPDRNEAEVEANKCLRNISLRYAPFQGDQVFRTLVAQLEAQYARVDQLLAESSMSDLPCPGRRCLTNFQTVREKSRFEYIDRVRMPFDLKAVERAKWRFLSDPHLTIPTAEYAQHVSVCGDSIQLSGTVTRQYGTCNVIISRRIVSRKIVEHDRTVFVTQSLNKPRVIGDVGMTGVQVLVTTVHVIRPGGLLPAGGCSTIIELYRVVHMLDADGVSKCPTWRFEPYIEVGLFSQDGILTREHQVLEDLLMER